MTEYLGQGIIHSTFTLCSDTVQSAKRICPSRLRTWNFASHVTFLRGFCEEVAWVLRGISVSFAKFCEIFFVEHGEQT